MIVRLSKAALVLMVGIFALLVGVDNIIDYGANFEFVRHVMSMDTVFPDNTLTWRAVKSEWAYHAVYALIIAAEIMTGLLATVGAMRLLQARSSSAATFNRAKGIAVAGLVLGMALWFFGFLTAGGEWFDMWQSKTWNGQEAAFRFIAVIGLVLVFLCQADDGL
jgi:predicted small integral membrane protein